MLRYTKHIMSFKLSSYLFLGFGFGTKLYSQTLNKKMRTTMVVEITRYRIFWFK